MTRATLLLALAASTALANEAFFKAEVVDAAPAPKLPTTPADPAWAAVPAKRFSLAAQRTVHLHDAAANRVLEKAVRSEVTVRALASPEGLALRLEWEDPQRDALRDNESTAFGDSVAVEVPEQYRAGLRLPAISMGDADAPVRLTLLRAAGKGALESTFVAGGFGSSTRQAPATNADARLVYDEHRHVWTALVVLPASSVQGGLVPVGVAVWDGARLERSGYKRLSSWHFVRVPGKPVDPQFLKEVAYGYFPGDLGDPAAGRAIAETVCIACHRFPQKALMPPGVAPDLSAIGAIATASYLRDSILTPSQVIVRSPNRNQHYAPGSPRDPNGAAPNNEMYQWSAVGADGVRVSKMPPFTSFTPQQLADLVAFLKTLDGPPLEND